MKRTNTILFSLAAVVLAVAITAGTASAAPTGFRGAERERRAAGGLSAAAVLPTVSINAVLGAQAATVGAIGVDRAAAPGAYRSVNSIVGSDPVPVETVSVVNASDGFSWGDAFIGAAAAFVVLLDLGHDRVPG